MIISEVRTDGQARSTGPYMHRMVDQYYMDMAPYASLSLLEIFEVIKSLPYRPDPADAETLMRPRYTMAMQGFGGDCDDKAIALASWARLNRIPYRFVASRRYDRKALHHVYTELCIYGKWTPYDCTYSINQPGVHREKYAEKVILPRSDKWKKNSRR